MRAALLLTIGVLASATILGACTKFDAATTQDGGGAARGDTGADRDGSFDLPLRGGAPSVACPEADQPCAGLCCVANGEVVCVGSEDACVGSILECRRSEDCNGGARCCLRRGPTPTTSVARCKPACDDAEHVLCDNKDALPDHGCPPDKSGCATEVVLEEWGLTDHFEICH